MNETPYKFHFPWRIHAAIAISLLWLPVIFSDKALTIETFLFLSVVIAMPILTIWQVSVISINSKGIQLYRVNKLVWSDITEAKLTSFVGLPYILIKRKKGMKWWLPLYFKGNLTVEDALISNAPKENPIYEAATKNT